MNMNVSTIGSRLLAMCLTCAVATSSNAQQSSVNKCWPQFGHGSNWQSPLAIDSDDSINHQWNIEVGDGRSQIVGDEEQIYVSSGSAVKEGGNTKLTTRIVALDLESGQQKWSYETESAIYDEQETFSGATASPQSTPAIAGLYLISNSFAGQLTCLRRSDGKRRWEKDLVKEFGAEPVQYGFSSSPIVDPDRPDRVFVVAAGKESGFYCLNVDNGSTIWKAECDTCSYATPVVANFGGVRQWLLVTENELIGICESDGQLLWRYDLPEVGLTNVPTPVVVDEARFVFSGQGCKGTRCLEVTKRGDEWGVSEKWYTRKLQLFYTNWLKFNDRVIVGCTGSYLAAIDVHDGNIVGKWRGYSDGNLAIINKKLLVLGGKGNLSVLEQLDSSDLGLTGFLAARKHKILAARCWTPVSIIANRILIRGGDRLVCLSVGKRDKSGCIANLLSSTKKLVFRSELAQTETSDPVGEIFTMFEAKGQVAALSLYSKLRAKKVLSEDARITLATSAKKQGLLEVAKMVMSHAVIDFPDSKNIASAAKSILDK